MPPVLMFGLTNNIKNMQPDWTREGEEQDLFLHNGPDSLKEARGRKNQPHLRKGRYWYVIFMVGLGGCFFFLMGLFLLFSPLAADHF